MYGKMWYTIQSKFDFVLLFAKMKGSDTQNAGKGGNTDAV